MRLRNLMARAVQSFKVQAGTREFTTQFMMNHTQQFIMKAKVAVVLVEVANMAELYLLQPRKYRLHKSAPWHGSMRPSV